MPGSACEPQNCSRVVLQDANCGHLCRGRCSTQSPAVAPSPWPAALRAAKRTPLRVSSHARQGESSAQGAPPRDGTSTAAAVCSSPVLARAADALLGRPGLRGTPRRRRSRCARLRIFSNILLEACAFGELWLEHGVLVARSLRAAAIAAGGRPTLCGVPCLSRSRCARLRNFSNSRSVGERGPLFLIPRRYQNVAANARRVVTSRRAGQARAKNTSTSA